MLQVKVRLTDHALAAGVHLVPPRARYVEHVPRPAGFEITKIDVPKIDF